MLAMKCISARWDTHDRDDVIFLIRHLKLTTASALSEELKSAIVKQIQDTTEMKKIELEMAVNEELIGGFVLQAGDKLIDASIAYDLKNIATQFDNNDFIYKIR